MNNGGSSDNETFFLGATVSLGEEDFFVENEMVEDLLESGDEEGEVHVHAFVVVVVAAAAAITRKRADDLLLIIVFMMSV
jgi:hypothetical protein